MKTCSKCKEEKDESYFGKNTKALDGRLLKRCKMCISEYQSLYREKNADRLKEIKYNWNKNNRSKVGLQSKRWWASIRSNEERLNQYYDKRKKREKSNFLQIDGCESIKIKKTKYIATKNRIKRKTGSLPSKELLETILLLNQTKQLCRTLNN